MNAPSPKVPPASRRPRSLGCFLACILTGCAVGPNFVRPNPDLPAKWSPHALAGAGVRAGKLRAAHEPPVEWWRSFKDPTLTSLIERSAVANLDVREGVLRIEEARAERAVASAGFWPSLGANAEFTRQRLSINTPNGAIFGLGSAIPELPRGIFVNPFDQYQLGLTASWELDLFGRVRRQVEAADATTLAAIEDERDVLISLESDVGETYLDLRGAQLKRSIVVESLRTQRDVLALTRQRWRAGQTTDLDVENASSEVSTTAAQLPLLDREITQDINELSELMDREPGALRAELITARAVPPVPPLVPIGLPSDLARRRPDIRRAEANLHAATARIGVAVAGLFPELTLTAAGGYQSEGLAKLIGAASRFASIGPTLELPVFDAGAHATVRLSDVQAKEAGIDYARTVLGALHDVENVLAAYGADQDRRVALTAAAGSSRIALELARDRYETGITSFLEVLDAERTLEQNQLSLADATTTVSTDLVALYKALGGGWQAGSADR